MFVLRLNRRVYTAMAFVGMTLMGCVADTADEGVPVDDAVAEESIGVVEQALDTCSPKNSGSGTWGSILVICVTPDKYVYVKKWDGSAFSSSGTLELKIWIGTIMSTPVYQGSKEIWFGQHFSGWYSALFTSNNGGYAQTGEVYVP